MRSNSGLERFQRPSVSHNTLSAANFRADIGINPLKRLRPAGSIGSSPRGCRDGSKDCLAISIKKILGSAKQTRFVRLPSADGLDQPPVKALLATAAACTQTPLPATGHGDLVIRSVSAKQRVAQAAEDLISGAAGPIAQRCSPWPSCGFTEASFASHIAVKPDAATLEAVWQFEGRNDRLNSSSPLNQINN